MWKAYGFFGVAVVAAGGTIYYVHSFSESERKVGAGLVGKDSCV
jgi:hypothetical protein